MCYSSVFTMDKTSLGHAVYHAACHHLYPRHTGSGFYYVLTTLSKKARA